MSNYGLILGLGTAVKGRGVCKNGELKIGDWRVTDNFLPLELGGVDVILGMHWLHSLGVTEVDWKKLTMILYRGEFYGVDDILTVNESNPELLGRYEDVLDWLEDLPPKRGI
ncbi:ty3-gypsy retroelement transposase [Cucumis melo var. makuwa]|uniref:Ty3-gypsy retroelement transposase n=1 Tax=Cucumis melo var. makuwa TaxID=1194695 RepID=A0A5A7VJF4_CUCMM|nr:ty3-gypsy retroelement transposase [Cucumis melo var. makuwa]